MRYFKNVINGYFLSIGTGVGCEEITKEEYENIREIIKNRPIAEGKGYKLKEDLTWEEYDIEIVETFEPTETDYAEAGKILMGVSE